MGPGLREPPPMTLQPGEHWEGLKIVGNPVYNRVPVRTRLTKEQIFFGRVVQAASDLHREGVAITARTVWQFNPTLPEILVAEVFATLAFAAALEEQGIPLSPHPGLSPEQMACLLIYMDMTVPMTHAQKLRACKVTEGQFRGWMRQGEFANRMNQLGGDVLVDAIPIAKQRLGQLVDAGNLPAMTLLFEMTGVHDRRKETFDINGLLMQIFSILDEEVTDVTTLERIADKIKSRLMDQAPVLKISASPPLEIEESP